MLSTNKPKVDAELIFGIIVQGCQRLHRNEVVTAEESSLLIQVSDFMASIDGLRFVAGATLENRCEFVLANREHFQSFADSQNTDADHLRMFSLEELQALAHADAAERNALLNQLLIDKQVPSHLWSNVRYAVAVFLSISAVYVCLTRGCATGLDQLGMDWILKPAVHASYRLLSYVGSWLLWS